MYRLLHSPGRLRIFVLGLVAGTLLGCLVIAPLVPSAPAASERRPEVTVALYKYRIKDGKAGRFADWMKWHNEQHAGLVQTLEPEHMYVEAIFRDRDADPQTFYWLTVQGPGGQPTSQSTSPLDAVHTAFGREVIEYPRRTLSTEAELIPDFLLGAIELHEQSSQTGRQAVGAGNTRRSQ